HVHLTDTAHGRSMRIRVTVPRLFPAADRPRLSGLARRWNRRGGPVEAVLCRSVDPTRIGVVAEGFVPIDRSNRFDEFADLVDASIAHAAELFGRLAAVLESPHARSRRVSLSDAS